MKKKIVITAGDPAGCGPFIALKAINEFRLKNVIFYVVGDKKVLEKFSIFNKLKKVIHLIDVNTPEINRVKPGFYSRVSGQASLNYIKEALRIMKGERMKTLVTAPVSKEAIQMILPSFSGHTEFLARHFGVKQFAMMMTAEKLRIALLTRHIPLRRAPNSITKKLVTDTIRVIHHFLKEKMKIRKPKIGFSSMNPHAGINTFLGREESIIKEAIGGCGLRVDGPYPADTLFLKDKVKHFDCIIVCYHDAGMIPFKLLSFKTGVNLTLGLPIIRTSPAHGVAFDLMRKRRKPLHSSMAAAIKLAHKLSL